MGSWAFGSKWFYVQLMCALVTGLVLFYCIGNVLGAVALGIDIFIVRPVVFLWRFVRAVVFLPGRPEIAGNIVMRGPHGSSPSDAAFLKGIRGRDTQGKPYQFLAVIGHEVVRVGRGSVAGPAPKTHGMDYQYTTVHGASSRKARKLLEDTSGPKVLHLCKHHPCTASGDYVAHAACYGSVGEEQIIDLVEKFALPTWWQYKPPTKAVLECSWKCLRHIPLVAKLFYWLFQSGKGGVAAWKSSRGSDSESETDHEEHVCIAHRVLLGSDGQGKSLCDRPCPNRASDDWLPLLEEDLETSRLPEEHHQHGQVKLCRHHWQAYKSQRHTRKCARLSCWRLGTVQIDNVLLCAEHARSGDLLAPLRQSGGEAEVDGAKQRLLNLVAQRTQHTLTEWTPGGPDLVALVRSEEGHYYGFNASTEGSPYGSLRDAFYFRVPALGMRFEAPLELGPIKERGLLQAAIDMHAPILCMTARKAMLLEGQGLAGRSLDEQGSSHPLVTVLGSDHSGKDEHVQVDQGPVGQAFPSLSDRLVARLLAVRRRHSCGLDAAEEFQNELGMDDLGAVCEVLARRVRTQSLGVPRSETALNRELAQLAHELETKSIPDPVAVTSHALDEAVSGLSMASEHSKGSVRFADNYESAGRATSQSAPSLRSKSPEVSNPFRIAPADDSAHRQGGRSEVAFPPSTASIPERSPACA
eukprot:2873842-Amphidinium_carterae.1